MSSCTHPHSHMTYEPTQGGVNEYVVCTTCGHRVLVNFHPKKK